MNRWIVLLVAVFALCNPLRSQPAANDSLPPVRETEQIAADTMFVIPSGPVAGTFTAASRVTVSDTVAGWARILIEGWVPVAAVMNRLADSTSAKSVGAAPVISSPSKQQCMAITKKGTRCKRTAKPGSKYCWQHQP